MDQQKEQMLVPVKFLAAAWRAKGLIIASQVHGEYGDLLKDAFTTCASDLEAHASPVVKENGAENES